MGRKQQGPNIDPRARHLPCVYVRYKDGWYYVGQSKNGFGHRSLYQTKDGKMDYGPIIEAILASDDYYERCDQEQARTYQLIQAGYHVRNRLIYKPRKSILAWLLK